MSCKVLLTELAKEDLELIREYFIASEQENRIERFYAQMAKVIQRIAMAPEAGSWTRELLGLGIKDCREMFSHPFRVIYHYNNNTARILLIADARRDVEELIKKRYLML
jgi:toxin ParE1/3/4